jgi:hypothetical protein
VGGGRSLDLAGLIQQVQSPPFQTIGCWISRHSSLPRNDSSCVRSTACSPRPAEQWLEGASLDPASLRTRMRKPRVAISPSRTSATPSGCSLFRSC